MLEKRQIEGQRGSDRDCGRETEQVKERCIATK